MKYLSVCSGIEAATVAWHHLGWTQVGFSEIEKFPSAVLAHHYPHVLNLGDMSKFKEWNLDPETIDLLVGGTPCQSFSVAGLRKGLDDPRGGLMLTFLRIAQHYRPKWIVWENVPGVLSSGRGRDFGSFLGGLAQLGYGFAFRVLDAQWFGVPQRRRRVFVVGCIGDTAGAAKVLFERESVSRDTVPSRGKRETVATSATGRTGVSSHWDGPGQSHPTLSQATKVAGAIGSSNQEIFSPRGAGLVGSLCASDSKGVGQQFATDNKLVACLSSGQANAEITHNLIPALNCPHEAPILFQPSEIRINGKITLRSVCPTITSSTKTGDTSPSVLAPRAYAFEPGISSREGGDSRFTEEFSPALRRDAGDNRTSVGCARIGVRRLTPRECERLQGFPDDWTRIPWRGKPAEQCPDAPRYKAIGNSMAVPVMRWIGARIATFSKRMIHEDKN